MYQDFYGLTETPFTIAPNPDYLFLSARHQEALHHLIYGLSHTGGFILLTGEVGTGKTTLSRYLLEHIPENSDTAFILNPSLTEIELLESLCNGLKINTPAQPTLKQLTDLISQFLVDNHEKGRQTILFIDEAQHLQPEVLEQLRLLTNLETNTKKLLQVVLIGQPELQDLLKKKNLRQLAQRITARYHLLPLTQDEVSHYVCHRLRVAGREQALFSASAMRTLFQQSQGIPRLINLITERSLMAGYASNQALITKKTIQVATREVLGDGSHSTFSFFSWPTIAACASIFALGAGLGILPYLQSNQASPSLPSTHTIQTMSAAVTDSTTIPINSNPLPLQAHSFSEALHIEHLISASQHIDTAFAALLKPWQLDHFKGLSVCQSARRQEHACYEQIGTLLTLTKLNYPAVVAMQDQEQTFFAALLEMKGERMKLQLVDQQVWVSRSWFNARFTGRFHLIWRPEQSLPSQITFKTTGAAIQWLDNSLSMIRNEPIRPIKRYDQKLAQKLKQFQNQHGLKEDGIAGPNTLVQLNLMLHHYGPHLIKGV